MTIKYKELYIYAESSFQGALGLVHMLSFVLYCFCGYILGDGIGGAFGGLYGAFVAALLFLVPALYTGYIYTFCEQDYKIEVGADNCHVLEDRDNVNKGKIFNKYIIFSGLPAALELFVFLIIAAIFLARSGIDFSANGVVESGLIENVIKYHNVGIEDIGCYECGYKYAFYMMYLFLIVSIVNYIVKVFYWAIYSINRTSEIGSYYIKIGTATLDSMRKTIRLCVIFSPIALIFILFHVSIIYRSFVRIYSNTYPFEGALFNIISIAFFVWISVSIFVFLLSLISTIIVNYAAIHKM